MEKKDGETEEGKAAENVPEVIARGVQGSRAGVDVATAAARKKSEYSSAVSPTYMHASLKRMRKLAGLYTRRSAQRRSASRDAALRERLDEDPPPRQPENHHPRDPPRDLSEREDGRAREGGDRGAVAPTAAEHRLLLRRYA